VLTGTYPYRLSYTHPATPVSIELVNVVIELIKEAFLKGIYVFLEVVPFELKEELELTQRA
jgi:hypothetical protein